MDNIWYYILLFIFIFIIIRNSDIDLKNLLLVGSIGLTIYFYYNKIKPKNYVPTNKNVTNNSEFASLLERSILLKNYNRSKYIELNDKVNLFLEIYNNLGNGNKGNLYDNAAIVRKDILNLLSSYEVSNEIDEDVDLIKSEFIHLLDKYMKSMEKEVNMDWIINDININSSKKYFNSPEAYNQKIDSNFEIF